MPFEQKNPKKESLFLLLKEAMEQYYEKDAYGEYCITPYVSYNEYLADEEVKDILASDRPMDVFYVRITDAYWDYNDESVKQELIEDLQKNEEFLALKAALHIDAEEEIRNFLAEHTYTSIPYEHYLKQDVQLNIIVDTGDLNTDFTENNLLNYYAPDYTELEEGETFLSDTSSLLWLCQKQDISKKELEEAILRGTAYTGLILETVSKKETLEEELEKLGKSAYSYAPHKGPYKRYLEQKERLLTLDLKIKRLEATYEANAITFPEYQRIIKQKNLPMQISNEADFSAQQTRILTTLKEQITAAKEERAQLCNVSSEIKQVQALAEELALLQKEQYLPLSKTEGFLKMQFLESVLQESRESTTHMNALTFCVTMSLEQAIRIQELICKEKEANHYYEKEKRLGTSSVLFDKDVCCGLYDAWNGAGGLFEIRLWKDIELPIKYIQSMNIDGAVGYSLRAIYGRSDDMWTDSIKEVIERDLTTQKKSLQERISQIEEKAENFMEENTTKSVHKER